MTPESSLKKWIREEVKKLGYIYCAVRAPINGWPDSMVIGPSVLVFLEIKSDKAVKTPLWGVQIRQLATLASWGHPTKFIRGREDAEAFIRDLANGVYLHSQYRGRP